MSIFFILILVALLLAIVSMFPPMRSYPMLALAVILIAVALLLGTKAKASDPVSSRGPVPVPLALSHPAAP